MYTSGMNSKKGRAPQVKLKNAPQKRTQPRKYSVVLRFITIIVISIIVIISIYIVTLLVNKEIVKHEAAKALSTSSPILDTSRDYTINKIMTTLGEVNEPNYSSKVAACYLTNTYSGWNVTNWSEECTLLYTDLIATHFDHATLVAKLGALHDLGFYSDSSLYFESEECDSLWTAPQSSVSVSFIDWSKGNNSSCKVNDPQSIYLGAALGTSPLIKTYRTYAPERIDKTKSYLLVTSQKDYYKKSLGCGAPGFFGCQSPYKNAIAGF